MNIPMVNLKSQYQALKQEIDSALIDALSATQFILGPNVQAFEQEAADYLGVPGREACRWCCFRHRCASPGAGGCRYR
jgi:dTDP-4-amino-4,6-dideoxygalactose transaminase